ncbi:MAG: hypothetical protein LBB60_06985 [Desulfovibrio sp.]|nr:hypothetical protein [Desulfovibrio sp.]
MTYFELLNTIKEMMHNDVEICIVPSTRDAHYISTPYNFSPKLGKKMVLNPHIDMGQGLLASIEDAYVQCATRMT